MWITKPAYPELEPLDLTVPHEPGLTTFADGGFDARLTGAARIYPHHLDSGGLFLAKLRRLPDEGTGAPSPQGDGAGSRWSTVPLTFPGDPDAESDSEARLRAGLEELQERYGVDAGRHPEWRWTLRGGRGWLHTVDEWPVEAWNEGDWRVVAIGQRALEFDSRGRLRPTNDFLRLLGGDVRRAVVDVSQGELATLVDREPVAKEIAVRGPVAIRLGDDIVGRGAATREGLVSEIPKARAADLKRILHARVVAPVER